MARPQVREGSAQVEVRGDRPPGEPLTWGARHRRPTGRLVLSASAILAVAVVAIPLVYLVVRVAEADKGAVADAVWRSRTAHLTLNSLALVVVVATSCLVLGVATAWVLARTDLPCRRAWLVVSALPLAIPSYVAAFGWVASTPLRGFWGAVVVLTFCNVPLVTLPAIAALHLAHPAHDDVARTLGRSRWLAFREVTWPEIRPAALAGALLAALYVLGDFGGIALMRFQALPWAIHNAYSGLFDRTLAAVLSVILVVLGVVLVIAERRMRGAQARFGSSVAVRTAPSLVPLGRRSWLVHGGLAVIAIGALGVPLVTLATYLPRAAESAISTDAGDLASDALSTVAVGGAGAAVALLLALPIGILAARHRSRLSGILESVSYLGLALPGIVVGLSLVFFSLGVVPVLYQSFAILAFAYGVLFVPKAVGAVRSSLETVEPGLEDVARSLGVTSTGVWFRVTARIAWPGIAAGALLVALSAMKELPATLLLRPTGTDTLATSLWRLADASAYAAAAPYALTLVVVSVIPALLLTRRVTTGRSRVEVAP